MDAVLRFRATLLGCLVILALLGVALATSDAEAAQPIPNLVTEDMQRQLDEAGSVMLSVTYHASEVQQAEVVPADQTPTEAQGLEVLAVLAASNSAEVMVTSAEALLELSSDPNVQSMVIPPYEGTFSQTGQADLRGAQRSLAIEAAQMHARGHLGVGVTVAIIDTGIDRSHPDLVSSVSFEACVQVYPRGGCADGTNFQTGPGAAADGSGHGTQMASAVTSDGTFTPIGVAPEASIEAVRISATTSVDLRNALVALDFILENRGDVDVVMLSFGSNLTFETSCTRDLWPPFYDTARLLRDRGVFITASAGNNGLGNGQSFPACLDDVYAVTALNVNGTALATSSNVAASTDLAAPGSSVSVHTATSSGTSIANALAAGCAALAIDSGQTTSAQIGSWLQSPNDSVAALNRAVPTMQCAPYCLGEAVTINMGLGEIPTNNRDVVLGTSGNDVIVAGFGDDLVCAETGDDLVFGGQGNDQVEGGDGVDRLWGNSGDDSLFGGSGADTLHGGPGIDDLRGQGGDDRLYGYSDPDTLSGGQGNDRLHGNAGADSLAGDAGDDILYGYSGDDRLDGGIGLDICRGNDGANSIQRCETRDGSG